MENQSTPPIASTLTAPSPKKHPRRRKFLKIAGICLLALCLIGGGFGAGYLVGKNHANTSNVANVSGVQQPTTQTNTKKKAGKTRLTGVVTAVTSTSLTITAAGKTHTITLTPNTTYSNNVKPAVNNTIEATGTSKKGVFTATQITVKQ